MKKISPAAIVVILFLGIAASSWAEGNPINRWSNETLSFRPLIDRLVKEGFSMRQLRKLFADSRAVFLEEVLDKNLIFRESKFDYSHFLDERSIGEAERFLRRYLSPLSSTEEKYGVDKEIIVAILLVESGFGRRTGPYGVLSVYASLAMTGWPDVARRCQKWLRTKYPETTELELARRIQRKSRWAYEQIKYLLRLNSGGRVDVLQLKGSWAGAFGMPQFIPSSYWFYAVDGNRDHVVHLDHPEDAIASVANYLKKHGWKEGLSKAQKRRIIWSYNHSNLYVDTIMKSAEILSERIKGNQ